MSRVVSQAPVRRAILAAVLAVAAPVGVARASGNPVATRTEVPAPANATVAALRQTTSFSLALGASLNATTVRRLATRDLVVVDGGDTSAAQVRRLKAKGALVLGYLSVGTVESWRSWFGLLRDHRLERVGDWEGERYTDLTSADARQALADTITPLLLAKGFDGLFLDNVDMLEIHPEDAAGMLDTVTRISAKVHAAGGALMAQNGDTIISPYVSLLDGWNREDPTGTYDFTNKTYVATNADGRRSARTTIAAMKVAGLLVTTTDYFASPTSVAARRAVRISCKAGAVPFIGNIALNTVTRKPQHC